MTFLTGILRLWWTLSAGAAAFALYRAFQLRLHRRYPMFTVFLALIVVQYLSLVWLSVGSDTYRLAWMWFEPMIGLGIAAIAIEAWVRLSGTLPADPHLWTLIGSGLMAVGVIASLLSSQLDRTWWDGALQFAVWSRRYLASTFAVALASAALVAHLIGARFTSTSGRNTRLHLTLSVVYLFVTSVGFISINAWSGRSVLIADSLMSIVFGVVFAWWGLAMKPEDEPQTVPVHSATAA